MRRGEGGRARRVGRGQAILGPVRARSRVNDARAKPVGVAVLEGPQQEQFSRASSRGARDARSSFARRQVTNAQAC
jgi:hypothetical protein